MDRRTFLTGILQALLLALFPWLRTERGLEAAGVAAEHYIFDLFGQELPKGVDTVATTLENGELQSDMLVAGVSFHIEPEPVSWRFSDKNLRWTIRRT